MNFRPIVVACCLTFATLAAQAFSVGSLSPQGEVAGVRRVVLRFDEAVQAFGDPKAAAPAEISCSDAAAAQGSGRWNNAREWVFAFEHEMPPGVRCSIELKKDIKSAAGTDLTGTRSYQFNSGGPFVQHMQPNSYSAIDEEQHFLLRLNGPANPASVQANVWCALDNLGERVPVRLIEGETRAALLKSQGLEKAAASAPLAFVTLACNRLLSPGSSVQLVYGKGVATPSGIANSVEKRFTWKVRQPFALNFSCERENANAACLPIRPMTLGFNAPVTRKMAEAIRLKSERDSYKPVFKGEAGDAEQLVSQIEFPGVLPEQTRFVIELPKDFADASGRKLANPEVISTATAPMPPLAKFAAAPFGIVERYAEDDRASEGVLPVTLRKVEVNLPVQALELGRSAAQPASAAAQVNTLQPKTDAEIITWFRRVQRFDAFEVPRTLAAKVVKGRLPKVVEPNRKDWVQSRMVSLLAGQPGLRSLKLPQPASTEAAALRPFEVVGIPLAPGFHVLEISSHKLGESLLDERHGAARPMVVRTSALVTNLGVHFKLGRENAMAWVTTLDKGQPVAGALVRVSDCNGHEIASASTNAQGVATLSNIEPEAPRCGKDNSDSDADSENQGGASARAYFVSARAGDGKGGTELAFTWSDWNKGIEPWRFNVPTSREAQPDQRAHTIFDRTLLRLGETVSMKHLLRSETQQGFAAAHSQPGSIVITHSGSGQTYSQALNWRSTATGGLSAESEFKIPSAAKLGQYQVELRGGKAEASFYSGTFRVEEFRLPVLTGSIAAADKKPLVNVKTVPVELQVNYLSGGPAARLPVKVSALLRDKSLHFDDYDEFHFRPPRKREQERATAEVENSEEEAAGDARIVADKLALTLDANGLGRTSIAPIAPAREPRELVLEASFADPSGEIQTLRSRHTLWPAAVLVGLKTEGWVSSRQQMRFQALALDVNGKPKAGVALEVNAIARSVLSSRKRMVGGFYSYDNKTEIKDLGRVCSGKSDDRGLLLCEAKLEHSGEVELVATASDADGNRIQAASSVYVTRQGELWFGGENHDRIDIVPEKKSYQPGETARLQVRMPFRFATALVAVEREGIIHTEVVQLNGQDPTVNLKIKPEWGPNVYVSVLVLRGRLREVPWYSFFTWGFKAPGEWWNSYWHEGREYAAPTALVDLSKPAFRLGLTELRVGTQAHQLAVTVKADREAYPVRAQAKVTIAVKLPNGQPAAKAEVALAAVDQALLELMPNSSWNVLDAMLQRRSWGVETATAQMEIIGRRHYGRKAVPAGGGGGRSPTRELLDTLLLWNPKVQLDGNGQAQVTVPLNDVLGSFQIVAIADSGLGLFGTGQLSIRTTQDLQIISGLPPLVREGDQFRAQVTLRNTTAKAMTVALTARATLLDLPQQSVEIPANQAREVAWNVTAPTQLAQLRSEALLWELQAQDPLSGARDGLKASQRIVPALPLTVQQATLVQLDGPFNLEVSAPVDAMLQNGIPRGGLRLALQPRLTDGLPAIRDWFAAYPYSCLEQKTSKAIGLRDAKAWQSVLAQLPSYLDADGLANYFPPREGDARRGSDTLTAYLLAASHEAAALNPAFAMSDEARAPLERALVNFVEGRIQRDFWSPSKDLEVRKLAAIEALSRYGKASARMLGSITIAPNQWPTHAVIDWLAILKRVADVPQREQRLAEAQQVLRARLNYQGTRMGFSTERDDYWWWLMSNGDINAARLLLNAIDDPLWKDDVSRLVTGMLARQQRGTWLTTTANLWGSLALEKFSNRFEATAVSGQTRATLGAAAEAKTASIDWAKVERVKTSDAGGAPAPTVLGAPASPTQLRNNSLFLPWSKTGKDSLNVTHQGSGKPWLTLQSVAAIELKAPFSAGYTLKKTITAVEQAVKGAYSRGDVLRIKLEVNASANMTWVVLTDPVPGGATILGSGLGRDSEIASQSEKTSGNAWLAFDERSFEAHRSYWAYLPQGNHSVEYTVRLNNVGDFALPPSRVEAMYAPEMFGEWPNARVKVQAAATGTP